MASMKLSVVLATYNEEKNLPDCLESVKDLADEIVIVDGRSTDKTVAIAEEYHAKVLITDNQTMFHINKQKALDAATNEWILQLDADERVSNELSTEIKEILNFSEQEMTTYQDGLPQKKLFLRHQYLLEQRDGNIGTDGEYAGFFIPRLNYFLGKYLHYGGVYPDGVIRLVKKGKAHFPCKDVHEQIIVDGKVGWLQHPLYHYDSPTFQRYLQRNARYVALLAKEIKTNKSKEHLLTPVDYLIIKPIWWFFLTFGRHKGFKDGWQGFVFASISALRFPRAYLKSLVS